MAKRARPKQNGKKFSNVAIKCDVEDCENDFFVIYPEPHHRRVCAVHYFNPPQPKEINDSPELAWWLSYIAS